MLPSRLLMYMTITRFFPGSLRRGTWGDVLPGALPHSALGYEPPERFAHRLGAPGLDEGPRPSPALAPAPGPCYDLNGSPSPRT